jgi:transposase-like protein
MDDAREWAKRPLEDVYPVIFLDALVLKIGESGSVQRRACYLALGITVDGDRDVLGMWFQDTEGAKFWMQVLTELKQRGACVCSRMPLVPDGRTVLTEPEALNGCNDSVRGSGRASEPFIPVTNAIEALNRQLRKAIKTKGHFPNEDAARKLIYLAVTNAVPAWTRTRNWPVAARVQDPLRRTRPRRNPDTHT